MALTSQHKLIAVIIAATAVLFGGLVFALLKAPSGGVSPDGQVRFNDASAPFVGKADASVVVRMYSDFQCPACKASEPALKAVIQEFQDRVKFVWKDFPLMTIHPNARLAANAARCAEAQGKFWEYHDRVFETQEGWAPERSPKDRFVQFARELGLNEGEFVKCYDDRQFDAKVLADVAEGEANGVNATPTFYVNERQAQVRSEAQWRSVLNQVIREQASSTQP